MPRKLSAAVNFFNVIASNQRGSFLSVSTRGRGGGNLTERVNKTRDDHPLTSSQGGFAAATVSSETQTSRMTRKISAAAAATSQMATADRARCCRILSKILKFVLRTLLKLLNRLDSVRFAWVRGSYKST